ncbi:MAG: hypothetical protein HOV67_35740 [Kribbellaceae bacterium]|nr:hypothetical protein [Kribbellaceae bacterium]
MLTGDAPDLPSLKSSYRPVVYIDVTHEQSALHTAAGVHLIHADNAQNAVDAWNAVPA